MALGNEELYDALEARLPRLFDQGPPRWERQQDHRGRCALDAITEIDLAWRHPDYPGITWLPVNEHRSSVVTPIVEEA